MDEWVAIEGYRWPYRINRKGCVQKKMEDGSWYTLKPYTSGRSRVAVKLRSTDNRKIDVPVVWLRLAAYEDTELEPEQVKAGAGDKAPCPLCDNARVNGELTDENDLHYRTVGVSEDGFRVMVGAGGGRPMRILFEQRRRAHPNRNEEAWMTVGIYEPKFCPNCGRELREYGGQK